MKSLPVGAAALLLFLSVPLASAEETFGCHSWEVFAGDREQGVGASTDDGAAFVGAGGFYFIEDGPPVLNPWLWSFWFAQEENGVPGPQRGDETCDETQGGELGEPDCFHCTF